MLGIGEAQRGSCSYRDVDVDTTSLRGDYKDMIPGCRISNGKAPYIYMYMRISILVYNVHIHRLIHVL